MPFKSVFPSITRIVLAGCGGKAGAYSGVYEAVDETGVLSDVDKIAGSSSGFFSAAMIATNVGAKSIKSIMQQTNLAGLMGERSGTFFKTKHDGRFFLSKNGKPLEHFIRQTLIDSALQFLKNQNLKNKPLLQVLYSRLKTPHATFTFRDLEQLHQAFPQHFKSLTVHAVAYPDGQLKIFNSTLTPDVDIADACRASCSIPIILEPKMIDGVGYMDGSVYENFSTEYFDVASLQDKLVNKKPQETLVFGFGSGTQTTTNRIFQALFQERVDMTTSAFDKFQGNFLPSFLVGLNPSYQYTDKELESYQRIRERYPLRTVQLHAGSLTAFDFDGAKKFSRILDAYGYLDTMQFIINHDVYDAKIFQPELFYEHVLTHFFRIYQALLIGSGQSVEDDRLWRNVLNLKKEISALPQLKLKTEQEKSLIIHREIFQYVKEQVTEEIDTESAFALSRAVEVKNQHLSEEQLLEETRVEALGCHVKNRLFQWVYLLIYHEDEPAFNWHNAQLLFFNHLLQETTQIDLKNMEHQLTTSDSAVASLRKNT